MLPIYEKLILPPKRGRSQGITTIIYGKDTHFLLNLRFLFENIQSLPIHVLSSWYRNLSSCRSGGRGQYDVKSNRPCPRRVFVDVLEVSAYETQTCWRYPIEFLEYQNLNLRWYGGNACFHSVVFCKICIVCSAYTICKDPKTISS